MHSGIHQLDQDLSFGDQHKELQIVTSQLTGHGYQI